MKQMSARELYSLLLYYGYAGMLAVSFLFMSASGMLGHEDHVALRFIVTAAALFGVYAAVRRQKKLWALLLGLLALAFNPVWHPHHLGREFWQAMDLAAAGVFLVSFLGLRPKFFADGEPTH